MLEELLQNLSRDRLEASRMSVRLRFEDGTRVSRSCSLKGLSHEFAALFSVVSELFRRADPDAQRAVSGVGITLAELQPLGAQDPQLSLFTTE